MADSPVSSSLPPYRRILSNSLERSRLATGADAGRSILGEASAGAARILPDAGQGRRPGRCPGAGAPSCALSGRFRGAGSVDGAGWPSWRGRRRWRGAVHALPGGGAFETGTGRGGNRLILAGCGRGGPGRSGSRPATTSGPGRSWRGPGRHWPALAILYRARRSGRLRDWRGGPERSFDRKRDALRLQRFNERARIARRGAGASPKFGP